MIEFTDFTMSLLMTMAEEGNQIVIVIFPWIAPTVINQMMSVQLDIACLSAAIAALIFVTFQDLVAFGPPAWIFEFCKLIVRVPPV